MHLTDPANGLLGANGIVGGGVGTALGAALASWMDGADRVALTVFGDGTINQGHVHECLNMAALYKLPAIFLCENNRYAEMTALEHSSAVTQLCGRVAAYGIATQQVDGNDAFAVHRAMLSAVERARTGGGPTFIEAMTYRTCGHYQNDPGTGYRTKAEVLDWAKRSPFIRFAADSGLAKRELEAIDARAVAEVEQAIQAALAAPAPDPSELEVGLFR